ncbi:MAG: hypothetical protein GY904_01375 [Planctomycetaceae bacterium]|nr:hypothetical protein [Planctomycetaceae bacterium]
MKGELNSSIRKNTRKIIWLTCPPSVLDALSPKPLLLDYGCGDLNTEPWGRRLEELTTSSGERWPRRRCQNPRIDPTQEPLPSPPSKSPWKATVASPQKTTAQKKRHLD